MPRPNRIHAPGSVQHVIQRGNRRQTIFEDPSDYLRFERALLKLAVEGAIELLAYCLMPNHFHLLVRILAERLGKALAGALTSHAVYMNKKYGRTGHLYEGRYQPLLVESDGGLKHLLRYTHQNPVRAKLVQTAEDWAYSSDKAYRYDCGPGVSTGLVLGMFSPEAAVARGRYAEFMSEPTSALPKAPDLMTAIASRLERERGFSAGVIKGPRRPDVIVELRRAFIGEALKAGIPVRTIASFLNRTEAAVYAAMKPGNGVI